MRFHGFELEQAGSNAMIYEAIEQQHCTMGDDDDVTMRASSSHIASCVGPEVPKARSEKSKSAKSKSKVQQKAVLVLVPFER